MAFKFSKSSLKRLEGVNAPVMETMMLALSLSLALVAIYVLIAANQLGYKCEWGGTWTKGDDLYGWDMPHFNITER